MNAILIKLFATVLTLSQVTTRPEAVKTAFDPAAKGEVVQILRDGCAHMRKAFDIEDINLDELIATAMEDPQAVSGGIKALQGLDLRDLHAAYREFCKNETVQPSAVDLGEVIAYYNKAAADLPDHTRLKGAQLPGTSVVLDAKGERFTEVFEADHRRAWVPSPTYPRRCRRPSSPPRTSASSSTRASTSAASSAPSSAISPSPGGPRAARPSPSRS